MGAYGGDRETSAVLLASTLFLFAQMPTPAALRSARLAQEAEGALLTAATTKKRATKQTGAISRWH